MKDILMTLIILLIVICAGVGFYFLIKYNLKKYNEENDNLNDKTVTKADMNKAIAAHIKKIGRFGDFSLIYLDIDNFTATNDVFGREQCDEFLQEICARFQKRFPYRTVISKYNNDEFLVFIKENLTYEQVCKVAEALLQDVKQKLYVSTTESISLSASAGICLYPSCGKNVDELLRNIELATYISKREGGNKYTVYNRNMTKDESSNYQFFIEIKNAIQNKEFCLYYQPIINLNTNNICAYEALMRWNHPEKGVLPPAKFMNIMEQSGDVYWVGKWGLELIAAKHTALASLVGAEFKMSLNLSTKQLTYEKTADELMLVVKKANVKPENIILEISGYTMFEHMENVKQNLLKLRDNGFTMAVDGFELDYSTITKIQKEPIDMIKLNRSFLSDIEKNPGDKEIKEKFVTMLVESANIAHRTVVCEGVETKEQEEYIKSKGITIGQGYYYSKPIPEDEIEDFIRYRKWEEHKDAGITNDNENAELTPEELEAEANKQAELAEREKAAEKQIADNDDNRNAAAPSTSEAEPQEEKNDEVKPAEPLVSAEPEATVEPEAPAEPVVSEPQTEEEPSKPEEPAETKESEAKDDEDSDDDSDNESEKKDAVAEALRRRRELLKQKQAQAAAQKKSEE